MHMEMHPVDPGFFICSICLSDIYSTVFTRIRLVVPDTCRGIPALRTTVVALFPQTPYRCAPSYRLIHQIRPIVAPLKSGTGYTPRVSACC